MNELLKADCYALRRDILDIIHNGKCGHIGGDLSVTEVLATLYLREMNVSPEKQDDPDRDYFIMSKGHCMEAYYAVLGKKGFINVDDVKGNYSTFLSPYIGHPHNTLPGIEMNSGSLGHGLPVSVGIAKAIKMDGKENRVYVVMGDGELAEGSVWEGAMAASHFKLDNLLAVVDRNRLQISGSTEDVMHHDDLAARFGAFGWHVIVCNGNDTDALLDAYKEARETKGMPTVVIAETTKGKGVSFMENIAAWHHKVPDEAQYQAACAELKAAEDAFRAEYSASEENGKEVLA